MNLNQVLNGKSPNIAIKIVSLVVPILLFSISVLYTFFKIRAYTKFYIQNDSESVSSSAQNSASDNHLLR